MRDEDPMRTSRALPNDGPRSVGAPHFLGTANSSSPPGASPTRLPRRHPRITGTALSRSRPHVLITSLSRSPSDTRNFPPPPTNNPCFRVPPPIWPPCLPQLTPALRPLRPPLPLAPFRSDPASPPPHQP